MSLWDELGKEVGVETEQLNELLASHRALLDQCRSKVPGAIERSALAAVLHAFYTGVENIFLRNALRVDGVKPQASGWHQELLNALASAGPNRTAVISPATIARLTEYLAFRHASRHSYTFQLRWEKMKPLVLGLDDTLRCLQVEFTGFLDRHRK